MIPKVFGSHTPARRGAGATPFAATGAAVRDETDVVRGAVVRPTAHLFRRLAACHAIGADIVGHPCGGIPMEREYGFPRLRVVFRIIDGDAILEPAVRQHAETLGERQPLGMWQARRIHHRCINQSGGAYHESTALPVPDRKTHRERQRRIRRTGSQIDNAEPSIPAVDERDAVGVGADFYRIPHREDAGHSGSRAPGRRIE